MLSGLYFHSKDSAGEFEWQGMVAFHEQEDWYVVQLFSWLDGSDIDKKLVRLEEMADWTFYDSAERMREKGDEFWERKMAAIKSGETGEPPPSEPPG
jgi:hypothetical protein